MGCDACNCAVTPSTATRVTTSAVEALALDANPNRLNAIIQNLGTTDVFVYYSTGAGANAPIVLKPGQPFAAFQDGVGTYRGKLFVISGAAGLVGVTEEVAT